jgi:uncharacterized membrane protein
VLWAVAAAIALPRLWSAATRVRERSLQPDEQVEQVAGSDVALSHETHWLQRSLLPRLWQFVCLTLLVMSCAYVVWGTPARLSQRLIGWRPPFGTLNGLDYMAQGRYSWPDDSHPIDLRYDHEAITWLLEHVRGNPVVVESSEVDYYRAGSSRVASLTGLSGLRGMHVGEQRYGEQVGARDGLHREFWTTPDIPRTEQIIDELAISLIYVGELERYLHPDGVEKLARMAEQGSLIPIFANDGVVIYAVADRMGTTPDGHFAPLVPAEPPGIGVGPLKPAGMDNQRG